MSRHNGSPTLGLLVDDVPFHTLDALALTHGVQIVRVISESPARAAGLREGDILVEVNGRPVFSVARLRWLVRRAQPGRPLNVAFNRAGAIASVSVTPDLTRSSN